jgi:hypothetical protein
MQYWEIVADKLSAAGWWWGFCSVVTPAWQAVPLSVTNRPMAVDDLTLQCRDIIPVQR